MIRLVGIDVDGTLLDSSGAMPEANREAIHTAVRAGIHVALVTGRSYPFARPVADPLPESITLIVSNGAVERRMDGSTIARRLLDRRIAKRVLDDTRPHRNAAALIFDRDAGDQLVYETMDWEHPGRQRYWTRNRSLIAQSIPLEDALIEDPIQVMFNGAVDEMRELSERLRIGAKEFAVSLTEYPVRNFSLLDITSADATKGRALAWRARQLGLSRREVMAVGDNFNDIEMLEFAGTPVVMGNAVHEMHERGWYVTGHQDEAGLADAIRRLRCGRQPTASRSGRSAPGRRYICRSRWYSVPSSPRFGAEKARVRPKTRGTRLSTLPGGGAVAGPYASRALLLPDADRADSRARVTEHQRERRRLHVSRTSHEPAAWKPALYRWSTYRRCSASRHGRQTFSRPSRSMNATICSSQTSQV